MPRQLDGRGSEKTAGHDSRALGLGARTMEGDETLIPSIASLPRSFQAGQRVAEPCARRPEANGNSLCCHMLLISGRLAACKPYLFGTSRD